MPTVLVLTNSYDDAHVNAVTEHIHLMGGKVFRVDTDRLLSGEQNIAWDCQSSSCRIVQDRGGSFDLFNVSAVWFRKPFGFGKHGFAERSIDDPVQREVVEREVHDVIDGLCLSLSSRRWINHPKDMSLARLKPFQLQLAHSVGLAVPDSIITNDPATARTFCGRFATVFKMLSSQSLEYSDKTYYVDTTLMTDGLIERLDFIRSQPILLQRCIDKIAELRVTYVDGEVFVAKQTVTVDTSQVDWRSLQNAPGSTYEPSSIPSRLITQIRSLMERLNLKFAAIDFAVDRDETLWFLEVNPNGQWLGYTDEIGLPAASAMARLLVS